MNMSALAKLFWLFIAYSFCGWLLETVHMAVRKKKFVNRGFLNGPLCIVYGIAAVLMTVGLQDLKGNWFFLFLLCAITATAVEWVAGATLAHFGIGKWWDYSNRKFNIGGYVCLECSLLWGLLGVVAITWVNPLLMMVYDLVPELLRNILLLVILGIVALDAAGSAAAVLRLRKMPRIEEANEKIEEATQWLGNSLVGVLARRLEKAHPKSVGKKKKIESTVFAQGCGFYKLFALLVIGAFLGDIVETIFCRITGGVWMSRSSLVWGQFSMVWGLALAAGTALLYRYQEKSDSFLFLNGFLLGGAYEYFCSVFTEKLFGTIFWDYSHIPFNLGGRINLLYCFFWGVAAVAWLRLLYPFLSKWIEKIPKKIGTIATWVMVVFLVVDIVVTCGALARYHERTVGVPANNPVASFLDEAFPDEWMEQRYQNMKLAGE